MPILPVASIHFTSPAEAVVYSLSIFSRRSRWRRHTRGRVRGRVWSGTRPRSRRGRRLRMRHGGDSKTIAEIAPFDEFCLPARRPPWRRRGRWNVRRWSDGAGTGARTWRRRRVRPWDGGDSWSTPHKNADVHFLGDSLVVIGKRMVDSAKNFLGLKMICVFGIPDTRRTNYGIDTCAHRDFLCLPKEPEFQWLDCWGGPVEVLGGQDPR